jgi:hypothetical protein
MTTLSTTLPLGGAFANKAFTPVSPISLSASTTYWAVITDSIGDTDVAFTNVADGTGPGFLPYGAFKVGAGVWGSLSPNTILMQVNGTLQSGPAVPEPSSFVLFGGIMMGALLYRQRRVKQLKDGEVV